MIVKLNEMSQKKDKYQGGKRQILIHMGSTNKQSKKLDSPQQILK